MDLGKKQWLCQKEKKRDDQTDESTNEIVLPTLTNLSLIH